MSTLARLLRLWAARAGLEDRASSSVCKVVEEALGRSSSFIGNAPGPCRCGAMTPCDAIESSFWCIGVGDVCAEHSRRALGSAILTAGGLLLPYGPPGGLWGLPSGRCKRQRHLQRAGDPPCTGSSAAAARALAGAAASHLPLLRSVLGLYVVSNSVGTLLCSTHSAQGSRSNLWRAAHLWRVWTRCRCLLRAAGTQAAARTMDLHHRLRRDPSW